MLQDTLGTKPISPHNPERLISRGPTIGGGGNVNGGYMGVGHISDGCVCGGLYFGDGSVNSRGCICGPR